jgi:hypothetical protein
MATNGGTFSDYQTLAAQIASAEPEYTVGTAIFSSDQAVTAGPYGKLWVLLGSTGSNGTLASTNGQNLYLADVSKSGTVCTLTVTNDGPPVYGNCGGTSSGSAGAAGQASVAPANVAAPAISSSTGNPVVGETLTETSNGSWNPAPTSYSYQWEDCTSTGTGCAAISGATSTSYTVTSSDTGHAVYLNVTAYNGSASASALDGTGSGVIATPIAGLFTFESSLQGWAAGGSASYPGATIAQSSTQAHTGNDSALITTDGSYYYQGAEYNLVPNSYTIGQAYTAGVWVKGVSGADLELLFGSFNSSSFDLQAKDWIATGSWQYETVTWTPSAAASYPLVAVRTGGAAIATTFYIDDGFVKQGNS